MSEVTNSFQGNFPVNCQQESIPFPLLSLCSLLIDRADPTPTNVSQAALSVSQLIMFSYKKQFKIVQTNETSLANRRHHKKCETPLPIYVGLKLMTMRAKAIIQKLFLLGICVSYDRCLDICNNIAVSMLKKFDNDRVFTRNSRKNLFTIIAKDNIDVNSKSTKVGQHYHVISMTIMQFLSNENYNGLQQTLYNLSKKSSRILELPESYTNFKELPFKKHSPLLAPVSTYTNNIFDNKNNDEAIKDEIDWLDQVSLSNLENCSSWSKHYSAQVAPSTVTAGIHSMLPPISKKVASMEAWYHWMNIIHKTIELLNQNQILIDVSDQPVYAYLKEVQWRHPTIFGRGKYLFTWRPSY